MNRDASLIRANLESVRKRMETAALAAGRRVDDVKLVAVSKFMSTEKLRAALLAGQTCFGENYVQEALNKQLQLDDARAEWHFIGHLQGNKARHVPEHFVWLHTLDSLALAHKLSAAATRLSKPLNVLLQVNIAADPGKQGLASHAVFGFVEVLLEAGLPSLRLQGLMTIGRLQPGGPGPQADFAALRELGQACATRFGGEYFRELSMGMSDDFELAIAEGATLVRIGSAIFGPRPPARA